MYRKNIHVFNDFLEKIQDTESLHHLKRIFDVNSYDDATRLQDIFQRWSSQPRQQPERTYQIPKAQWDIIYRFLMHGFLDESTSPRDLGHLLKRVRSQDLLMAAYRAVGNVVTILPPPKRIRTYENARSMILRGLNVDRNTNIFTFPSDVTPNFVADMFVLVLSGNDTKAREIGGLFETSPQEAQRLLAANVSAETIKNALAASADDYDYLHPVAGPLATTIRSPVGLGLPDTLFFGRRAIPMNTFVKKYCAKFGRSRKHAIAKYKKATNSNVHERRCVRTVGAHL